MFANLFAPFQLILITVKIINYSGELRKVRNAILLKQRLMTVLDFDNRGNFLDLSSNFEFFFFA